MACLACCASCFVGIIEGLVEYFNRCAFQTFPVSSNSCKTIPDMPTLKLVKRLLHSQKCRSLNLSALYGKPYIAAAKDTWKLFKDRGRKHFSYQLIHNS